MSTKSTVVGRAKVMSYEDIMETQKKHDAKEANKKEANPIRGAQRGRKRKRPEPKQVTRKPR
jgi:hypothetical protein